MAEYFGLPAIARRMGVSGTTIGRWRRVFAFPVFRRGLPGLRVGQSRATSGGTLCSRLYTNDAMILAWELGRANQERLRLEQRRAERLMRRKEAPRTTTKHPVDENNDSSHST